MFGKIRNLIIMGVISGESTAKAQVKNRNSHLLIYKVSGESVYCLRGKETLLAPGSVLYVPQGETYEFEKISGGESKYYLVNFHADFENDIQPVLIYNENSDRILRTFKDMEKLWSSSETEAETYEIVSLFYHLVSLLADCRKNVYTTQKQKEKIEPAILYLEERMYSSDLKTSELAKLCNLSDVMFRKIFYRRFGMSPKKYIINRRMKTAGAIFESGEYDSVAGVAKGVGYDDPLHFSKSFKAFYGISPTDIRKKSKKT